VFQVSALEKAWRYIRIGYERKITFFTKGKYAGNENISLATFDNDQ